MKNVSPPHALALFSGGLDSILASRLIAEQGIRVTCLHFCTPFFGKPHLIPHWEKTYGLTIRPVDISDAYVRLLAERPVYGFGSVLNPCVDCKVLMINHARTLMEAEGACCIISGEVLGQRPMSQRRETLNIIRRDAGVKGLLLRPLSALCMEPTKAEEDGIIDRSRLLKFSGRGRKNQLALARRMGITEIPTPAGGCLLTEQENARSYWAILRHVPAPEARDFYLANAGRQVWQAEPRPQWLTVGRNQSDNDILLQLGRAGDMLFKVRDFTGPVALGRQFDTSWTEEEVKRAAAYVASYSTKAVRHYEKTGEPITVRVHEASLDAPGFLVQVVPDRSPESGWQEPGWENAQQGIKREARAMHGLFDPGEPE